MRQLRFGALVLDAPPQWEEFTDFDGDEGQKPYTLARADRDGGALQFSAALYRSGKLPNLSVDKLLSMAREMGAQHSMGRPFDERTYDGAVRYGAASYHHNVDFVRFWYLCDGRNVAMASYNCPWEARGEELPEVELIVASLRFADSQPVEPLPAEEAA